MEVAWPLHVSGSQALRHATIELTNPRLLMAWRGWVGQEGDPTNRLETWHCGLTTHFHTNTLVALLVKDATMLRVLSAVALMAMACASQAQNVKKCTQADGSVAYQTDDCGGGAVQETLDIDATPLPPAPQMRHMVQAFDPATGVPREAWADGPAPPPGATYTTREFRTVVDPQTGIPRQALVDVQNAVPAAPPAPRADRYSSPGYAPQTPKLPPPRTRYNDGDVSTYEKAKCKVKRC